MSGKHEFSKCHPPGVESDEQQQRRGQRLLCSDLVKICWSAGRGYAREEMAVLEDYSRVGAGLFLTSRIEPGVSIRLRTDWEAFGATVRHCAWRENGYSLGIEFDEPRPDDGIYVPDHLLDLADLDL
jgi:hypothetical protein